MITEKYSYYEKFININSSKIKKKAVSKLFLYRDIICSSEDKDIKCFPFAIDPCGNFVRRGISFSKIKNSYLVSLRDKGIYYSERFENEIDAVKYRELLENIYWSIDELKVRDRFCKMYSDLVDKGRRKFIQSVRYNKNRYKTKNFRKTKRIKETESISDSLFNINELL